MRSDLKYEENSRKDLSRKCFFVSCTSYSNHQNVALGLPPSRGMFITPNPTPPSSLEASPCESPSFQILRTTNPQVKCEVQVITSPNKPTVHPDYQEKQLESNEDENELIFDFNVPLMEYTPHRTTRVIGPDEMHTICDVAMDQQTKGGEVIKEDKDSTKKFDCQLLTEKHTIVNKGTNCPTVQAPFLDSLTRRNEAKAGYSSVAFSPARSQIEKDEYTLIQPDLNIAKRSNDTSCDNKTPQKSDKKNTFKDHYPSTKITFSPPPPQLQREQQQHCPCELNNSINRELIKTDTSNQRHSFSCSWHHCYDELQRSKKRSETTTAGENNITLLHNENKMADNGCTSMATDCDNNTFTGTKLLTPPVTKPNGFIRRFSEINIQRSSAESLTLYFRSCKSGPSSPCTEWKK